MPSYFFLKSFKEPFSEPKRRKIRKPLEECLGFESCETIYSENPIPPYDEALKDGWALRSGEAGPWNVAHQIENGADPLPLIDGFAAPINTGGFLPEGADTVAPKKAGVLKGGKLYLEDAFFPEENVLKAGSEWQKGEIILRANSLLNAPNLALLQDSGISEASVWDKPVITLLATGEELSDISSSLVGKRQASNIFYLKMLIEGLGLGQCMCRTVGDNLKDLQSLFEKFSACSDFIISSGGTGEGTKDLLRNAVREAGGTLFDDALKLSDSKPFIQGKFYDCSFYGLPGNPLGFITLAQRVILKKLWNFSRTSPLIFPGVKAELGFDIEPKPGEVCVQLTEGPHRFALPVLKGTGRSGCFTRIHGVFSNPEGKAYSAGERITVERFLQGRSVR